MSDPRFPYSHGRYQAPVAGADAVVTEALVVGYPGGGRPVVREVDVRIPPATRVALVGPNGAGKSSLLKSIAGLLPVSRGSIRIFGNAPRACHHRVAYLPQRGEIDWRFPISVERLVLTGRYVHLGWLRWPGQRDYQIAREMLARLDLSQLASCQIGRLSGGQQQRALLARALAQGADLLLLDEPFNGVDAHTRDVIRELLRTLQAQGKTMVVATHDVGRLENDFDGVIYLEAGRRVAPAKGQFSGLNLGREGACTG